MEIAIEKKGEILNQLAIIADLLEKMNLESQAKTLIIQLEKNEFERIYNLITIKKNGKTKMVKDTFSMSIGDVEIVFNTSSV